jgi:CxC5 like cysteine cluster associated with KDZ transposases/CxC6 like cysteine cluster associated with KDZ transposases
MVLIIVAFGLIPMASANPDHSPFPDVTFKVFSNFVKDHFSSHVSLATVLTVLFTMMSNPDLLSLHARQQYPKLQSELSQANSAWIKALACALQSRLDVATDTLFHSNEHKSRLSGDEVTSHIGLKLDSLSKTLKLHPYNDQGHYLGKLKPISDQDIEPVHVICPISMECETVACNSHAILKHTRDRDTPKVMLIKGGKTYHNVSVLAGYCAQCQTRYYADHEHTQNQENIWMKVYLNSAKYLKIGQNIWVDRTFSKAVLQGNYHFHASVSAFAEFWNSSFGSTQTNHFKKVSRRQVWQAFVQESVQKVAFASGINLELSDRLPITEVTKQAFEVLGEEGVIRSAEGHICSDCTHEYKKRADMIPNVDDPAAVVGVDENQNVPAFVGDDNNDQMMNVDDVEHSSDSSSENDAMEIERSSTDEDSQSEHATVQMVVVDGIVFGPKHCAFEDCTADLKNHKTGVFCAAHETIRGHLCRIQNCQNAKVAGTQACQQHRNHWRSYAARFGHSTLLGIRRLVRRSEQEHLPWLPAPNHNVQPHDEPAPPDAPHNQLKNYFSANHFYCVEIIAGCCGLVWDGPSLPRQNPHRTFWTSWIKYIQIQSPDQTMYVLTKHA